jgi:hypothetical protein
MHDNEDKGPSMEKVPTEKMPVGERFFTADPNDHGAHPAFCKMGTEFIFFPWGKAAGTWR